MERTDDSIGRCPDATSIVISGLKQDTFEYFSIGDAVWGGMEIESLSPVAKSSITHFEWCGKKVLDNNFRCLSEGHIQELDINPTQFTMEELAELLSFFPKSLKGTITKPYVTTGIYHEDEYIKYHYLCKDSM